jgi:hypothetical protein
MEESLYPKIYLNEYAGREVRISTGLGADDGVRAESQRFYTH